MSDASTDASTVVGRSGWRPTGRARMAALVLVAECVALAAYLAVAEPDVRAVRYLLYPFVWMNVGLAATALVRPRPASRRARAVAGAFAVGYFLVLAGLSGLVGVGVGHGHAGVTGLHVTLAAPGWGPRVAYGGSIVSVNLVPYRVVGYLSLAYLVYVTALNAGGRALSGVVGAASCVGCSLPLVESLAVGIAGGAGAFASVASYSVDLSTLAFVAAVGLLTVHAADGVGPIGGSETGGR